MSTKIIFTLLLIFFSTANLYCQTSDSLGAVKYLLMKYNGGRPRYSKVSLKLYSDSTFEYSNWYHFGKSETDTGTYLLNDSSLILYSKNYFKLKEKKISTDLNLFTGHMFRIRGDILMLYTKEQEAEDKTNFYRDYFTLNKAK